MCGIVGFIGDLNDSKTFLSAPLKAIEKRGPDAEGAFYNVEHGIALGHRRLSIIDTHERANQPMHSWDQKYCIVFNGEIYNFRELQNQLNYTPTTGSDTEIIMEAYRRYGKDCIAMFNGMFSFLLYDFEKSQLLVARDKFGKKPLFWTQSEKGIYFGSELKALLAFQDFALASNSINKDAIAQFLHLGFIPEPATIYSNIHKFPSGHYGIFTLNAFEIKSYFEYADLRKNSQFEPQDLHQEFDTQIRQAVAYRLIADVPYGCLLSGGVDSSLVASYAAELVPDKLKTFTIGFDDPKKDESVFAKKIAKQIGSEHYEEILTEKDALDRVYDIADVYDEPFADSSAIPTMLVSQLAAKHVKMVLTGDGGDEMFLGYGAYLWAQRLSNPFIYSSRSFISSLLNLGNDHKKRAASVFSYTHGSLQDHIFSQEQYFFSQAELMNILKFRSKEYSFQALGNNLVEKQNYFDLKYYLKDDLLVKTDRASMYYGLEMRSPFLDSSLAEFAQSLTVSQRMEKGELKGFLKEHLYTRLPKSLFDRPKQGFSIPLNKWLKNDLYTLVEQYINPTCLSKYDLWNIEAVMSLRAEWEQGADRFYQRIWAIIQVQRFLEKNG